MRNRDVSPLKTKGFVTGYVIFDLPRNECLAPCDMWYQSDTENCFVHVLNQFPKASASFFKWWLYITVE